MDDTGTVGHRDITVTGDKEAALALLVGNRLCPREQRLIGAAFQIGTGIFFENLISRRIFGLQRTENGVKQRLCHVIGSAVGSSDLTVGFNGIDTERDVGRQCPGGRRPCKEIGIFPFHLEADNRRAFLDRLISLRNLVRGQRSTAARAIGDDLEALVQKTLVPDLLQCPPFGFDKGIMIGDVRIIHIRPEADRRGEILPHALVLPDRFLTFFKERLQTVCLDLVLTFNTDCLFNFQLNRQTVGIPTGLTDNMAALHRTVTRHHILDNTGQNVTDVRLAVGSGRTVVKRVFLTLGTQINALSEDILFLPEFFNFLFSVNKIQIC